jgi:hypothetical protein
MGKHLRSVREDNGTLSFRHEVSSRHPVYLWVADICRWGGPRPQDAAPKASARAFHSCSLIYIRQYLLKFGSVCRVYMCHLTTDRHDASWGAASHVVSRVGQAVHEMVIPWRTHRRGLELWWWCLLRLFCCCLRHGWRLSPEATTELIKLLDIK